MATLEVVQPLDGSEIKQGTAHKILEAIDARIAEMLTDAMSKSCRLYGVAYPKFRAKWTLELELEDFGRTFNVSAGGASMVQAFDEPTSQYVNSTEPLTDPVQIAEEGEIPFTPPDVFRKDTSQPVPVMVETATGTEQKAVVYRRQRGRQRSAE